MVNRVLQYCSDNGIAVYRFEQICGIGNGSVQKWRDGLCSPNLETIKKISTATGIPVSEWVKEE